MNTQDRFKELLADPPPLRDHKFRRTWPTKFVNPNSTVHADSLLLRSQYKGQEANLLEHVYTPIGIHGDAVASLATSS